MMGSEIRVLVLCTGNSARSQMAEGLLRHLMGEGVLVASAGTHPVGLHPMAVQAMNELGIDISSQRSESVELYADRAWDYVITVCDRAAESCPRFAGAEFTLHWTFDDPAAVQGSVERRLRAFRAVRDALRERLLAWSGTLDQAS